MFSLSKIVVSSISVKGSLRPQLKCPTLLFTFSPVLALWNDPAHPARWNSSPM